MFDYQEGRKMPDYRRIHFQKKLMQAIAEGINSSLNPNDETMRVFNECLVESDLKKWWRHLNKLELEKQDNREKIMRGLLTN